MSPTRQGKTESGVGYVKKNAIAGRRFETWEAFEAHLVEWERDIANLRIHGTTGEAPMAWFLRDEVHRKFVAGAQCRSWASPLGFWLGRSLLLNVVSWFPLAAGADFTDRGHFSTVSVRRQ